jgi:hypothetical protein
MRLSNGFQSGREDLVRIVDRMAHLMTEMDHDLFIEKQEGSAFRNTAELK